MKYASRIGGSVASTGFVSLLAFSAVGRCQEARTAIKAVIGTVSVVRGESRQPVRAGDAVLFERDQIATGPNSATAFALRDGTFVSIGANSALNVTSFQFEPTKQEGRMDIGLISGTMRFITGLLGKRGS